VIYDHGQRSSLSPSTYEAGLIADADGSGAGTSPARAVAPEGAVKNNSRSAARGNIAKTWERRTKYRCNEPRALGISLSWTTLARQLDRLAIIIEEEGGEGGSQLGVGYLIRLFRSARYAPSSPPGASDAAAVASNPALRELPGSHPVTIDEILKALSALDPRPPNGPPGACQRGSNRIRAWAWQRRPRYAPIWKLETPLKCRSCRKYRYVPPLLVKARRGSQGQLSGASN